MQHRVSGNSPANVTAHITEQRNVWQQISDSIPSLRHLTLLAGGGVLLTATSASPNHATTCIARPGQQPVWRHPVGNPRAWKALRLPDGGPADGQIASAGHPKLGELNTQTSDRWTKREVQAGPFAISWTFTANHVTRNWRYYLTKQGLEPEPAPHPGCVRFNPLLRHRRQHGATPKQVTHQCTLPRVPVIRSFSGVGGGDTNSFYNLIDARFKGGTQPPLTWSQGGPSIPPSTWWRVTKPEPGCSMPMASAPISRPG